MSLTGDTWTATVATGPTIFLCKKSNYGTLPGSGFCGVKNFNWLVLSYVDANRM